MLAFGLLGSCLKGLPVVGAGEVANAGLGLGLGLRTGSGWLVDAAEVSTFVRGLGETSVEVGLGKISDCGENVTGLGLGCKGCRVNWTLLLLNSSGTTVED